MRTLLNKPLRTFIIYASVVLLSSIPVYFFVVDAIWLQELDENNDIIAERARYQLERIDYEIHNQDSLFRFWNTIQPNSRIERLEKTAELPGNRKYTIYKHHVNPDYKWTKDRFRVLETAITINGQPCLLIIESNVEETYETVAIIGLITGVFFIILSAGFILLSRRMSGKIWAPFRDMLSKLKEFRVDEGKVVAFSHTDVLEFRELQGALEKLMDNNIQVFKLQKEFTENASHELQTPLAIIQTKLGLLLQSDAISMDQYRLVEEADKALARAIRINRNLLLLAKIENNQFTSKEEINVGEEITEVIDLLGDEFQRRSITLDASIDDTLVLYANRFLITTIIQNMVTNALRYCTMDGNVSIVAEKDRFVIANSGVRELKRDKLFQRFAVLDKNNPSTGIGLAMVHGICKQSGWDISYSFQENMHRFIIIFTNAATVVHPAPLES